MDTAIRRPYTFDTLTTPQLFDIDSDPGKAQNLIDAFPAIANDLMAEAEAARLELGDVDIIGRDQRVPPMADPQCK